MHSRNKIIFQHFFSKSVHEFDICSHLSYKKGVWFCYICYLSYTSYLTVCPWTKWHGSWLCKLGKETGPWSQGCDSSSYPPRDFRGPARPFGPPLLRFAIAKGSFSTLPRFLGKPIFYFFEKIWKILKNLTILDRFLSFSHRSLCGDAWKWSKDISHPTGN